jgi:hypothetical protein
MRPSPAGPTLARESGFVAIAVLLVVMFALAQKSSVVPRLSLLPLTFLIGFQAFRIPVELLIHRPVSRWDRATANDLEWIEPGHPLGSFCAAPVPFARQIPCWGILAWNTMAPALLLWIVCVAVLGFPGGLQRLKPDNVWVAYFFFVWLPTVAVTSALLGHVVHFRRLLGPGTRAE